MVRTVLLSVVVAVVGLLLVFVALPLAVFGLLWWGQRKW